MALGWSRRLGRIVGAVALSGITVVWRPFHSTLYPYSISLPSSFQHLAIQVPGAPNADFFFGAQGTSLTNVNIEAVHAASVVSPSVYLRSKDGLHVRSGSTILIMGHSRRFTVADFQGPGGKWREESVSFRSGRLVWRITISYENRTRALVPTMLRIVKSFKLQSSSR